MVIRSEWQNWNDSSAKSASNSSFHARRTRPLPALPAGAINDDGRGLRSDSRTGEREGRLLITFFFLDLQTLDVSVFQCYCSRRASVAFWSFRFGPVVRHHYGKDCVYISFFLHTFHAARYLLRRLSGLRSWREATTVLKETKSALNWTRLLLECHLKRERKTARSENQFLPRVFLFSDGDWRPLHLNSTVAHAGKKIDTAPNAYATPEILLIIAMNLFYMELFSS